MRFICLLAVFLASTADAAPLTTSQTYGAQHVDQFRNGTPGMAIVKGSTDNNAYMMEADPVTGGILAYIVNTVPFTPAGKAYVTSARNDYTSTAVTTGAWVQLIASTPGAVSQVTLFDSSGQTLELGTGAVASETRVMIIPPGGIDGALPFTIASGTRVSIRAISATASTGEIDLTGYN